MSANVGEKPVFTFDHMDIMHQLMHSLNRQEQDRALSMMQNILNAYHANDEEGEKQAVQAFKDRYSIQIELDRRIQ